MSAAFSKAVELILKHEGGYVNNPADPGGETNFGICKRSYPNVDIKNLTKEKAAEIYLTDYWQKINGDALDYRVGLCVFDSAVNQGVGFATKALQKAIGVTADGVIGPGTAKAANADPIKTVRNFQAARAVHYASLPTFKDFGAGWMRRLVETTIEAVRA